MNVSSHYDCTAVSKHPYEDYHNIVWGYIAFVNSKEIRKATLSNVSVWWRSRVERPAMSAYEESDLLSIVVLFVLSAWNSFAVFFGRLER